MTMPEIARFLGIIITIYLEADEPHQVAHFHVRYNEFQASYSIDPIAQLVGALPRRQQRLVEAGPSCTSLNHKRTGNVFRLVRLHTAFVVLNSV